MVFGAKVSRHQSRREQDYEVVGLHVGSREGVPSLGQTSSTQIPNHTSLRRPISRIFNEFHSHPGGERDFFLRSFDSGSEFSRQQRNAMTEERRDGSSGI
jgi:hypothetical protein